jgi:carbamoyltransferase
MNKKTIWGISANSHDAALAVFKYGGKGLTDRKHLQLKFASHSERFSGIKNDPHLSQQLVNHAKNHYGDPDEVVWYERPWKKTVRQLWAGQGWRRDENDIAWYLQRYGIHAPIKYVDHHHSHAAGAYYTSGFDDAAVLVIDSIGEFETLTVWEGQGLKLKKKFSQSYPHSVGLWYSAMTQRVGLKPNEDEYILMGMAAYGDFKKLASHINVDFIDKWPTVGDPSVRFKQNLHRGCVDWRPDLKSEQDQFDIAAATQTTYERMFEYILQDVSERVSSKNLVLAGGCALNCAANHIAKQYFKNVWIMPNPGDAGSSVGAVLARYQTQISWPGPYLGYNIKGDYPVEEAVQELLTNRICGVANGPSEFGPRALGNRSLLADPRGTDIRDRVNDIKQRQRFRPFAPAILAEHASSYFDGITGPYMQYTAVCRNPELYPAICHADGTSRVQTVAKDDPGAMGIRRLLEQWYSVTGCPMLLNTSLNIKGQPIVNNKADAIAFENKYGVKVLT